MLTRPYTRFPQLCEGEELSVFCPRYTTAGSIELPYRIAAHGKMQTRIRDRLMIEPMLDLGDYVVRATVDWVELRVQLKEPADYKVLRKKLKRLIGFMPYAAPLDHEEGQEGHEFALRLQDPTKKQLVALNVLHTMLSDFVGKPVPLAMEVAVDAFPRDATTESRQKMVALLQHHFLPPREPWFVEKGGPRSTIQRRDADRKGLKGRFRQKTFVLPERASDYHDEKPDRFWSKFPSRQPYVDGTFYVGPEKHPEMWRVQDKISNQRRGKDAVMLADEERRARIEVQLQGDAFRDLGITSVEELVGFRFEKLAKRYFSFWMATLPILRAEDSKAISLAKGWRRKAYWRLFASMGVMGVLRRDQETMATLKRGNESLPIEERVMENGKLKKYWIGTWTKEKDDNGEPWLLGEHGYLVSYKALNEKVRHALADLKL